MPDSPRQPLSTRCRDVGELPSIIQSKGWREVCHLNFFWVLGHRHSGASGTSQTMRKPTWQYPKVGSRKLRQAERVRNGISRKLPPPTIRPNPELFSGPSDRSPCPPWNTGHNRPVPNNPSTFPQHCRACRVGRIHLIFFRPTDWGVKGPHGGLPAGLNQ